MPQVDELLSIGINTIDLLAQHGISASLMGSLATWHLCPSFESRCKTEGRHLPKDIDIVTHPKHKRQLANVLRRLDFVPAGDNRSLQSIQGRQHYARTGESSEAQHLEIFFNPVEMFVALDVESDINALSLTLSPTNLFLLKCLYSELSHETRIDIEAILSDCEDQIDLELLHHTILSNWRYVTIYQKSIATLAHHFGAILEAKIPPAPDLKALPWLSRLQIKLNARYGFPSLGNHVSETDHWSYGI